MIGVMIKMVVMIKYWFDESNEVEIWKSGSLGARTYSRLLNNAKMKVRLNVLCSSCMFLQPYLVLFHAEMDECKYSNLHCIMKSRGYKNQVGSAFIVLVIQRWPY